MSAFVPLCSINCCVDSHRENTCLNILILFTRNQGADAPLFLAPAEGFEDSWPQNLTFIHFSFMFEKDMCCHSLYIYIFKIGRPY